MLAYITGVLERKAIGILFPGWLIYEFWPRPEITMARLENLIFALP
jgi:hypothetical protein